MATTTIAVSARGDKALVAALRRIAADKRVEIGDVVRSALDETYGDELDNLIELFAAQDEQKLAQSDNKKTTPKRVKQTA